jgi:hypothetical protein
VSPVRVFRLLSGEIAAGAGAVGSILLTLLAGKQKPTDVVGSGQNAPTAINTAVGVISLSAVVGDPIP